MKGRAMMRNDREVLPQVQRVFALVHHELGASFGRDKLFWLVERTRGKPLRYERRDLPSGQPGCCFALLDVDVICVRVGLPPARARFVDFHEAGHFLLQHVPRLSLGDDTPTYAEYCAHADQAVLAHALHRSVYDKPEEWAAELLGRQLSAVVRRYEDAHADQVPALPQPMALLYGDERLRT
jgi:hypothetical protein